MTRKINLFFSLTIITISSLSFCMEQPHILVGKDKVIVQKDNALWISSPNTAGWRIITHFDSPTSIKISPEEGITFISRDGTIRAFDINTEELKTLDIRQKTLDTIRQWRMEFNEKGTQKSLFVSEEECPSRNWIHVTDMHPDSAIVDIKGHLITIEPNVHGQPNRVWNIRTEKWEESQE